MGEARASNKDILTAIATQSDSIDRLIAILSTNAEREVPNSTETIVTNGSGADKEVPEPVTEIEVDPGYEDHMRTKAQDHANNKGESVVLYARKNKAGQTKLAYALTERYTTLKDSGLLGPLAEFSPE